MSFGRFREDPNQSKTAAANEALNIPGSNKEAFISKGSKITGNLSFTGPAEIDGQVDGEVSSQDRLSIGESAIVNAKVSAAEVTVRGVVNGDISASRKVNLKKPARVHGSIVSPVLSIEDGVLFEGKVSMPQPAVAVQSTAALNQSNPANKPANGVKIDSVERGVS